MTDKTVGYSLAKDGPIAVCLNRRNDYSEPDSVQRLQDRLKYDLQRYQCRATTTMGSDVQSHSAHDWLLWGLHDEFRQGGDPVLLDCILRLEGHVDQSSDVHREAMKAYLTQPEGYDLVLEGLIDELREEAQPSIEAKSTEIVANSTTVQQWNHFMHGLAAKQHDGAFAQGPPTGLVALDAALGGLTGLTGIGGDKGVGKTTLAVTMAAAALKADPKLAVMFYTLDMCAETIFERLLCHQANVDYRLLFSKVKPPEVVARLQDAGDVLRREIAPRLKFRERDLFPDQHGLSYDKVRSDLESLCNETDAKRVLICIDLFQRMDVPQNIVSDLDKDHFRLDVIHRIRAVTRRESQPKGAAVVVTSELRKVEGRRHELTRDDLLGAGRISSDADNILLMWPTAKSDGQAHPIVPLTLRIEKGRDGVERRDIPLWFHHTVSRFSDRAPEPAKKANTTSPGSAKPKPAIDPLAGS